MSKLKRVSHLSAVQGSNEERVSRTAMHGKRATEAANAAMRQKQLSLARLCRDWENCGG